MANYIDGFVDPDPEAQRRRLSQDGRAAGKVWRITARSITSKHGDDVKPGKVTSFPQAVKLEPNETVVFSWIVYKSREHRDQRQRQGHEGPAHGQDDDPRTCPSTACACSGAASRSWSRPEPDRRVRLVRWHESGPGGLDNEIEGSALVARSGHSGGQHDDRCGHCEPRTHSPQLSCSSPPGPARALRAEPGDLAQALTMTLKPPQSMRLQSKGIFFGSSCFASRLSFMTLALTYRGRDGPATCRRCTRTPRSRSS